MASTGSSSGERAAQEPDESQLTGWTRSGGPAPSTQSWTLSLTGDWTTTTRDGAVESRTNTPVHQVTQVGSNQLAYDVKGNLTSDEHGTGLAWDPENRLIRARITPDASTTGVGAIACYRYDALGRRIAKTVQNRTTLYLDAGAQTVVELDRASIPSQSDLNGATADGTLANLAQTPATGGILPGSGVTRINFQPQTSAIPAGFLADKGKPVAMRTNGLTYGWSSDVTTQAMERDAIDAPEFDTFIQAQTDTASSTWSVSLPNGSYPVVVIAGDAASLGQTDNLVIGGQAVLDTTPAGYVPASSGERGNFDGYAIQVTVSNGLLTIAPGSGAYHPKLCFIEIGQAGQSLDQAGPDGIKPVDKLRALVEKMNDLTAAPVEPVARIREYVLGGYMDECLGFASQIGSGSNSQYFVHNNSLYSPAAVTSSTGVVVERYVYDAYGTRTIQGATGATIAKSNVGLDRGFTGYVLDNETGLLYARARSYSSGLGRFVSFDPARYRSGFNLYDAYFVPRFLDPLGKTPYDDCMAARRKVHQQRNQDLQDQERNWINQGGYYLEDGGSFSNLGHYQWYNVDSAADNDCSALLNCGNPSDRAKMTPSQIQRCEAAKALIPPSGGASGGASGGNDGSEGSGDQYGSQSGQDPTDGDNQTGEHAPPIVPNPEDAPGDLGTIAKLIGKVGGSVVEHAGRPQICAQKFETCRQWCGIWCSTDPSAYAACINHCAQQQMACLDGMDQNWDNNAIRAACGRCTTGSWGSLPGDPGGSMPVPPEHLRNVPHLPKKMR